MNKRYKNVIRNFFSDYVTWILIIFSLFVISLVTVIAFGKVKNGFIWVIILFLFIYCTSYRLLILYLKVRKDFKESNIDVLVIKILKIEAEKTLGFENRGGATIGKKKYRIIDENGNYYLLSTASEKDIFLMFYPDPTFSLEIEVLRKSRIILRMKIIDETETSKKAREQKHNIALFRKIFGHYF